MFGHTEDDLSDGSIRWDRMTAPGYEYVNQSFQQQLLTTGSAEPAEIKYIRKDGSHFPALVGLASMGPGREDSIGFYSI